MAKKPLFHDEFRYELLEYSHKTANSKQFASWLVKEQQVDIIRRLGVQRNYYGMWCKNVRVWRADEILKVHRKLTLWAIIFCLVVFVLSVLVAAITQDQHYIGFTSIGSSVLAFTGIGCQIHHHILDGKKRKYQFENP